MLRSPAVIKKQPLLSSEESTMSYTAISHLSNAKTAVAMAGEKRKAKKVGEVAGGTAAECAAVCCCCPCTVVNLLFLAVYRVPTAVCKKAWRRRKRLHVKSSRRALLKKAVGDGSQSAMSYEGGRLNDLTEENEWSEEGDTEGEQENDVVDMEKEMWEMFYGGGFWRSPSQRHTS